MHLRGCETSFLRMRIDRALIKGLSQNTISTCHFCAVSIRIHRGSVYAWVLFIETERELGMKFVFCDSPFLYKNEI